MKRIILQGFSLGLCLFFYTTATAQSKKTNQNNTAVNAVCTNALPGDAAGSTGCVTFVYGGQTITYTTVRGADGNIWLQQNLGSSQVATSVSDALAYGDLFQWGRWEDGHQKRNSATIASPTPNNPLGLSAATTGHFILQELNDISWWDNEGTDNHWSKATPAEVTANDGCDPCKALGMQWRLPTVDEWDGVVTAENIANPTTAFTSNLKLTAAGSRDNYDGSLSNVGNRGYYWSSVSSNNMGFSKYLYIGSVIANAQAGTMRGQGNSVRCIYDHTAVAVSAVNVTVFENAAATITTASGTLQLVAKVLPDVVNQDVTWTVATGATVAVVNAAGVVTALENGTATIRATSVEDPTVFGEIQITVAVETAATENFLKQHLRVYPNPTADLVYFESDLNLKQLELFDFTGKKIMQTVQKQLNLQHLAAGMYQVKVTFDNTKTGFIKIIKK